MAAIDIPLVNLQRQYQQIEDQVTKAITSVIKDCAFIKGPFVQDFEAAFSAAYSGWQTIGCANGTAAISLALEALGVGKGDEVIVPAHTFIATAEAVCHVGAIPVFVDSNPDTYCIEVKDLASYINAKTKAIIPVHIYGNACNMKELQNIASANSLFIIEDCAQAHLATYHDKILGTFGDAGTFSFYPGKNLGAYGDAGAVITSETSIANKIRKLSDHGRLSKYEHDIVGYNQRMDGLQGAVLSVKLDHLSKWTKRRQQVASQYNSFFDELGIKRIISEDNSQAVYHLYVIEVDNREKLQENLTAKGISTGVHYPLPLHKQPAFSSFGNSDTKLANVEKFCERILSIPVCGSISDDEVSYVCESIKEVI